MNKHQPVNQISNLVGYDFPSGRKVYIQSHKVLAHEKYASVLILIRKPECDESEAALLDARRLITTD